MTGGFDPAQYENLVEQLLELQRRKPTLDPLSAGVEALSAVFTFLNADARLVDALATRPLGQLLLALVDRKQRAKPKLFFDLPNLTRAKGAPTYTTAANLRAIVNVVFIGLLDAGMPQQNASRWLATQFKRAGVKQRNGRAIDARVIARWRTELGGKSLAGSDKAFANFVLGGQAILAEKYASDDAPLSSKRAESVVLALVKLLQIGGF